MNDAEAGEYIAEQVRPLLPDTRAIVWDGCHKIYLALDDNQVEEFRAAGYDEAPSRIVRRDFSNEEIMLHAVIRWFQQSCSLRFISAVATEDGHDRFESVIEQFEIDTYEEEED